MSWNCPHCRVPLERSSQGLRCAPCQLEYPEVDGIPWLLPEPVTSLWEWRLRLKHLLQRLEAEAETYKAELRQEGLGELTLKRLRKVLQAKVEHRKALADLLEPLALTPSGSLEQSRAFKVTIPAGQSLTGYYANIHRDWAWETDENAAAMACLEAVLGPERDLGEVLALGAGACRLPYDLHQRYKPRRTVAADFNPLMLLAARRILRGKTVRLHEFPLAPRDLEQHAVLRRCAAPVTPVPGLELVFADALRAPFADAAFDTVLTPWLIDILPEDLATTAASVNRLLKPNGLWVNFGSLAFNHGRPALNYSYEETLAQVEASGFALRTVRRDTIPYMQSPASHHGRVETVVTFLAEKVGEGRPVAEREDYLPAWLRDGSAKVPRLPAFESAMIMHAIYVDALALIDGHRTLSEVSVLFAAKHGMAAPEAEQSLRTFLSRLWEESRAGASL